MKLLNIIKEDDYMLLEGHHTEEKIISRDSTQDFIDYMKQVMKENDYTVQDIEEEKRGAVYQYLNLLMSEAKKTKPLPHRHISLDDKSVIYKGAYDVRGYRF